MKGAWKSMSDKTGKQITQMSDYTGVLYMHVYVFLIKTDWILKLSRTIRKIIFNDITSMLIKATVALRIVSISFENKN